LRCTRSDILGIFACLEVGNSLFGHNVIFSMNKLVSAFRSEDV